MEWVKEGYQLDQSFPLLFTLTWNTYLTLRCTLGFYLNNVLALRPFGSVLYNVLLEYGGLLCVLPFVVHLDLGHLLDTQGYYHSHAQKVMGGP